MLAGLRAVKYEPSLDVAKTYGARQDVMRIFEPDGAPELGVKTRAAVADALAQAGDDRLRLPYDPDYWAELPGLAIGRYPVTVYEYAKFVDAASVEPEEWERQLRTPSRPVTPLLGSKPAIIASGSRCPASE